MKKRNLETKLQIKLVAYIESNYPGVYFHADASPQRNQLGTLKKMGYKSAHPDIFIYRAAHGYHGFAMELKKAGEFVYTKKSVTSLQIPRIPLTLLEERQQQGAVLQQFRNEGYLAAFVIGWGEAKAAIDWYLSSNYLLTS